MAHKNWSDMGGSRYSKEIEKSFISVFIPSEVSHQVWAEGLVISPHKHLCGSDLLQRLIFEGVGHCWGNEALADAVQHSPRVQQLFLVIPSGPNFLHALLNDLELMSQNITLTLTLWNCFSIASRGNAIRLLNCFGGNEVSGLYLGCGRVSSGRAALDT